jgi:peptidoglycan/LPS O-acetylase OafA/YrhL
MVARRRRRRWPPALSWFLLAVAVVETAAVATGHGGGFGWTLVGGLCVLAALAFGLSGGEHRRADRDGAR